MQLLIYIQYINSRNQPLMFSRSEKLSLYIEYILYLLLLYEVSHFLLDDAGDCTGPRLAKLKVNSKFKAPCKTSILYPADGGNMHCFTAKTACAVLDVLGPPYCDPEGRHCQYYYDFPFSKISGII